VVRVEAQRLEEDDVGVEPPPSVLVKRRVPEDVAEVADLGGAQAELIQLSGDGLGGVAERDAGRHRVPEEGERLVRVQMDAVTLEHHRSQRRRRDVVERLRGPEHVDRVERAAPLGAAVREVRIVRPRQLVARRARDKLFGHQERELAQRDANRDVERVVHEGPRRR
jgi:hypothetical protein